MNYLNKFKDFLENMAVSAPSSGMGAVVSTQPGALPGTPGTTGSGDIGFTFSKEKRKKGDASEVTDLRDLEDAEVEKVDDLKEELDPETYKSAADKLRFDRKRSENLRDYAKYKKYTQKLETIQKLGLNTINIEIEGQDREFFFYINFNDFAYNNEFSVRKEGFFEFEVNIFAKDFDTYKKIENSCDNFWSNALIIKFEYTVIDDVEIKLDSVYYSNTSYNYKITRPTAHKIKKEFIDIFSGSKVYKNDSMKYYSIDILEDVIINDNLSIDYGLEIEDFVYLINNTSVNKLYSSL
jgi:hypothetical protein